MGLLGFRVLRVYRLDCSQGSVIEEGPGLREQGLGLVSAFIGFGA